MVKVEGRVSYAKGSGRTGSFKVKQNFKTKKEADKFLKFMNTGASKKDKVKITEYRKPVKKKKTIVGFPRPKFRF